MAEISTLPTYEINSFSRWVAKATLTYFENPDVQARFEVWKKEKKGKMKNGKRFGLQK